MQVFFKLTKNAKGLIGQFETRVMTALFNTLQSPAAKLRRQYFIRRVFYQASMFGGLIVKWLLEFPNITFIATLLALQGHYNGSWVCYGFYCE